MKKYIPSKMILNSRFKEYFSALDEIEQQKTLETFNRLLIFVRSMICFIAICQELNSFILSR